ncbi:protein-export chaperone SecB [Mammaliicoccus sciuri]|uniref:protein-export chaperone SecB n=1 Tax=Mammaliicoccus sciuri TaxID=1296 RepID=UPI0018DD80D2|nr:protein-export chaperone SecB [Mammaliicoccus sciuri]QPW12481.1 protein-export chaperone SecB [Mammaliicoccus sciuri]
MSGELKFLNYEIEELYYRNDVNQNLKNNKMTPSLECSILQNENDKLKFKIRLKIDLGDEEFKKYDFHAIACIIGDFEIREESEYNLIPNAIAMLFPYIRSLISDLTSKGNKKPIILPPININELLRNAEIDKTEN